MIECPHCHTRVLPAASGRCPACGKSLTDREGADPMRTSMTIRENARLPAVCYRCGTPTDRHVTVRHKWKASGDSWIARALALLMVPFWPLWLLLWWLLGRSPRHSIRMRLPQCVPCSQLEAPNAQHVDFGAGEMTFVVHKGFRAATAALGKPLRSK